MTAVGVAGRFSASLPRHGRVGADGLVEALEPVGLVTWCWRTCTARRHAVLLADVLVVLNAEALVLSPSPCWCRAPNGGVFAVVDTLVVLAHVDDRGAPVDLLVLVDLLVTEPVLVLGNPDLCSAAMPTLGQPLRATHRLAVAVYVFVLADILAIVAVVVAPNPPSPDAVASSGRWWSLCSARPPSSSTSSSPPSSL